MLARRAVTPGNGLVRWCPSFAAGDRYVAAAVAVSAAAAAAAAAAGVSVPPCLSRRLMRSRVLYASSPILGGFQRLFLEIARR